MYLKNGGSLKGGVSNGAGWGGIANCTIAYHGGAGAANQNAHPAKEKFLGHHNQSLMGVNEWLNTSAAAGGSSYRSAVYTEMTLRNDYPYIFYWNPAPGGKLTPTLPPGLATWAPFRVSATVKNDSALKTGWSDSTRKVPFLPTWNLSRGAANSFRGGYINISMYGTYLTDEELDAMNGGTHFANWYYGMAPFADSSASNDGYFYELHGTISLSYWALRTYLNWTPGVANYFSDGVHGKAPRHVDEADARTWFNNELATRGMAKNWKQWLVENYSQIPGKGAGGAGGGGAAYWGNLVNNGNIYTNYEYDMAAYPGDTAVGLKADPSTTGYNKSGPQELSIRFYIVGWGPDACLIRMIEMSGIVGNFGTVGASQWNKRASMINYGEDLYLNTTIRENMANSSARWTATYSMLGWEDEATDVWTGGYQIEVGAHCDYIPNVIGSQDTYPSPFNKYYLAGTGTTKNDIYSGDLTKSRDWNAPGSLLFNTNASVVLQTPANRNLSAYEAIVFDLNILSSPWLVAKGWTAKYGAQTMALQPYKSMSATAGPAKENEYRNNLYWGTVVLGKGCYPRTQMLAMYNAGTKILNLSGGTTGLNMVSAFGTDWWGGNAGQTSRVYYRSAPFLQLDVAAVSSYKVTMQPSPFYVNLQNYWVKATPLNATGNIPRNGTGALMVNESILFSTNNAGTTWPGNGSSLTFTTSNASVWTTVRFGSVVFNTYVNVTDNMFSYSVGGSAVPSPAPPVMTQAQTGTSGQLTVLIPEFATVLIPIVGVMAIFFIFRTKRKKREE